MALLGPGLLLEGARTNLVTSDDISAWSATGTPVVTSGISDPAGGTGAYRVADDDAGAVEYPRRDITFTGNGQKAMSFVCREATMPASGNQAFVLYDATAGSAERIRLSITGWVGGEPTVVATTGTLLGKQALSDGYWIIYARSTTVTAANINRVRIEVSTSAAQPGSIDVYRVNAFNATVPPSLPLDASFAQAADNAYLDFTAAPQAMQVYHRCRDFGTYLTAGFARYWQIGDGTTGGLPRLTVYVSGTSIVALYETASGQRSSVVVPASFGYADLLELLVTLTAAGSVRLHVSVNEGAVQDGGASTTLTLPGAWAGQRLYIGGTGDGTRNGFAQHLALIPRKGTDKDIPYFRSLL